MSGRLPAGVVTAVVLRGGAVLGIVDNAHRDAIAGAPDAWINALPLTSAGNLSIEDPAAGDEPGASKGADVAPEQRFVNVEVLGQAPGLPLQKDKRYNLQFDIDIVSRAASVIQNAGFAGTFKPDEQFIDVTIQLASEDFEILTPPQSIQVPRTGASEDQAIFKIKPKQDGQGTISAVLLKNGTDFIQVLTIKLQVGGAGAALAGATTLGYDVSAMSEVPARSVNLTFVNMGNSFQAILSGATCATALLPITLPQLDSMISQVRKDLLEIVHLTVGGNRVYQTGIDIAPEVNAKALQAWAKAGYRLYQQLFYAPAMGADANQMGDLLRTMARTEKLQLRVVSQQFLLPWGILYMAEDLDLSHISPDDFLGFKHIIEHIPLQPAMQFVTPKIDASAGLKVSLNVNAGIDQQMGAPFIAKQIDYWNTVVSGGKAQLVLRKTEDEVLAALASTSTSDQIVYFNCHALSKNLGEVSGPDGSCLLLTTRDAALTLGNLSAFAPAKKKLPGQPLVFINACKSAELSPLFYDGFVPYFMSKGARGVIGTECETPAFFAAEWARLFFDKLLSGAPIGQIFLELRQEFYAKHNNVMGLLYALYCSADTKITPPIQAAVPA